MCRYAKVVSFFGGALVGVSLDLCVFQILICYEYSPFNSNVISSGLAICATYFFVSRYTFNKKSNIKVFLLFFIYYSLSILFFSQLIEWMVGVTGVQSLLCKIFSLPISFAVNFFFSRIILGGR